MIKLEPWKTFTTPRKMMVAAFVMQFLTLFILVKDSDSFGTLAVSLPSTYSSGWTSGTYWIGDPERTGFQARPLSILILPALFFMFATKNYERPWWHKNGYLVTVGIMLFFTSGGAMFREIGGFINISAFFLACTAAFKHWKWLKGAKNAGNVPPPLHTMDANEPTHQNEGRKMPPDLPVTPDLVDSIKGIKRSIDRMDSDRKPSTRRPSRPTTGPRPAEHENDQFFDKH